MRAKAYASTKLTFKYKFASTVTVEPLCGLGPDPCFSTVFWNVSDDIFTSVFNGVGAKRSVATNEAVLWVL